MAHLVKLAKEFDGELGLQIQYASSGGASDTNTTSAMGIPRWMAWAQVQVGT